VVGDPRERLRDLREEAVGLEEVEAVHVFGPEVVDVEGYGRPEQQPVHHRGEERDDVGVRGPHHVRLPDRREGEEGRYREREEEGEPVGEPEGGEGRDERPDHLRALPPLDLNGLPPVLLGYVAVGVVGVRRHDGDARPVEQ